MGKDETQHIDDTMKVGSLALITSRLAVRKAQHNLIKGFAMMETAEQETIADVLKSLKASGTAPASTPSESEAAAMLDDKGKQTVKKLEGLNGSAFDRDYLAAQLDGHEQLLKIQESYIGAGKNREQLNVAKLARGHIKDHITIIQHLRSAKA